MEEGLPDEDSDQSREGVLLHGYDSNPKLDRGVLKPYHRDLLRISTELDKAVSKRCVEQFDLPDNEPFETGREEELWVNDPSGGPVVSGHCDLWVYWPRVKLLAIRDAKFGYKIVTPAVANLQLRTYAIAGAQRWKADNVVVAITQPRLSFDERLTLAIYSADDIKRAYEELTMILRLSRDPKSRLVASEDACRYCKAKLICPAYKEKFLSIEVGFKDLSTCNDEQLEQVLVAISFADFIKDQARDEARSRVADGRMPNYKLGKESEMRNVADVRKAMALLSLRGDINDADVKACLSMSIGDLEEKVRLRKKTTWKEAKEIVEETLSSVIERKNKKPSLIRNK